jgi:starvation-inducible DNA-binding protein
VIGLPGIGDHDARNERSRWPECATNDLIVSDVIRRNELQAWFVAEHVVDVPLTHVV